MQRLELPSGFVEMMSKLLGDETQRFLDAMQRPPVVSVRVNSRKPSSAFCEERRVKWCDTGRYLSERPVFTLDPLLHAGAYYVQDASSMIYREVTSRIVKTLCGDEKTPLSVLDMCAAPGGKTTAIIDALPDGSRVVANEFMAKRAAILRENLIKWGYPDYVTTNCDTARFPANNDAFDIVAVDAPCSGEGMMRKDPDAVAQWSPELIKKCASLQRVILTNAVDVVKPGGFLIYSTCTFNREENEINAQFIMDEFGLEPFDPIFPEDWGIGKGIATTLPVSRFMPHLTEGEGLFLAIFRKPGDFEPSRIIRPVSKKRKADDLPDIEDILSCGFDRSKLPLAELPLKDAISYLKRESVTLTPDIPKGYVIMTYQGLPLGLAKNIGSRANNLYPKNWRILMR